MTRVTPAREFQAFAPLPAILRDLPEADPCGAADKAVYALESSIADSQAQFWAYLMHQPKFSVRRLARKPGEEIVHPEIRSYFFQRLAAWDALDEVPEPSADAVKEINDVTMRIRLVKDMCSQTEVATGGPKSWTASSR